MVIPASAIKFSDDKTEAWMVTEGNPNHPPTYWAKFNRQCDTCGGGVHGVTQPHRCPACHGTGRHVFTIDTSEIVRAGGNSIVFKTHRVYVLDILAIVSRPVTEGDWPIAGDAWHRTVQYGRLRSGHNFIAGGHLWTYYETEHGHNWRSDGKINLPDDAKPGDTAVHLKVVTT